MVKIQILKSALGKDRVPLLFGKRKNPISKPFHPKCILGNLLRISIPTTYSMGVLHESGCMFVQTYGFETRLI